VKLTALSGIFAKADAWKRFFASGIMQSAIFAASIRKYDIEKLY